MPRGDIEGAAANLLRQARERDLWDGDAPIPVELIAESLRDLHLDWIPLRSGDAEAILLGALHVGKLKIYLNESQRALFERTRGLRRFTVAHELGHFDLHVDHGYLYQATLDVASAADTLCRDGDRTPREIQAELFAAALLMPDELVRRYTSSASTHSWPAVYRLRERFDVSVSAMRNRLRDLGYEVPADSDSEVRMKIWP